MRFDDQSAEQTFLQWFFLRPDGRVRSIWLVLLFYSLGSLLVLLVQDAFFKLLPGHPVMIRLALASAALCGVLLLQSWMFLAVFDRRSFRTVGLWPYPGWERESLVGLTLGAALVTLVVGVLWASGLIVYPRVSAAPRPGELSLLTAAGALLFAAAFEEIFFRGYGFQRLLESAGPLGAIAVLAGLFGVAHLSNPHVTPLSTANTMLVGVLLSLAYLKTRALWLPIGLHWSWNFLMGPIFSLPVSGTRLGQPMLRARIYGPEWLSGGNYGPEGSVLLTVVCVGAIVWLARTDRIRTSPAMERVLKS